MHIRPRPLATLLVIACTVLLAACQQRAKDGLASRAPARGVHDVSARDLQFSPRSIEVPPGTTVTWHFQDGQIPHNVSAPGFKSGTQKSGAYSHTFGQPGTYSYHCTLHANMTGEVIVSGSPSTTM